MNDPSGLPWLIVGDVHGQLPRLFQALREFPPDEWRTVFLGDLVDFGPFGVGALRFARDRPNSQILLGNHEVMMLGAVAEFPLRGPMTLSWHGVGGQPHDLQELAADVDLTAWLVERAALIRLDDGTIAQHCDSDALLNLIRGTETDPVPAINQAVTERLRNRDFQSVWDVMTQRAVFERQPLRLESWLKRTNARRVVHGHTPLPGLVPRVYAGGRAIGYDGGRRRTVVAPLPVD